MQTFEVTLKGFNITTSKTDHLIKWVNAKTIKQVYRLADSEGWDIETTRVLNYGRPLDWEDGVDYILE